MTMSAPRTSSRRRRAPPRMGCTRLGYLPRMSCPRPPTRRNGRRTRWNEAPRTWTARTTRRRLRCSASCARSPPTPTRLPRCRGCARGRLRRGRRGRRWRRSSPRSSRPSLRRRNPRRPSRRATARRARVRSLIRCRRFVATLSPPMTSRRQCVASWLSWLISPRMRRPRLWLPRRCSATEPRISCPTLWRSWVIFPVMRLRCRVPRLSSTGTSWPSRWLERYLNLRTLV
mmetsp:Transcript_3883/g.17141  ORF Transcript_3883/g.17141 Transcript_3883/m.17141 type:complete len:230 (-) Transcript_3883:195-884(-)